MLKLCQTSASIWHRPVPFCDCPCQLLARARGGDAAVDIYCVFLKHIELDTFAMPSETPGRSIALRGDETQHRGSKRRRTSDRTELTVPSEASDATSTARGSLMTSSPQPGSSREMSPPEGTGPVKYTRTGRVSKATKGQRIHQCDECGKVCSSQST